jgi:hypothetical protein
MTIGQFPGMGFQNPETITANKVIIIGPNGGLFVFDPSESPGGLLASVTGSSTDPVGDATIPFSFATYGGDTALAMSAGILAWFSSTSGEAGPWTETLSLETPFSGVLELEGNTGPDLTTFVIGNPNGRIFYIFPTGDTTGVADTAVINSILAANVTIIMAPGQYYWACGQITITDANVGIQAACPWAVQINGVGTGDTLRATSQASANITSSIKLDGFVIDNTNAGAGSSCLHLGELRAATVNIGVQNCTGAGSIGAHLDNQYGFTEECRIYVWAENCTQHVVFDVSNNSGAFPDTSNNSFGYGEYIFEILAKIGQDGVVVDNGALPYNGKMSIRANFQGNTAPQTNAVLRITGQMPAGHPSSNYSQLASMELDIQAECNDATGTNAPYSIYFGTLSQNAILGCRGIMDFAQGSLAFQPSNWTPTGATGFSFDGVIRGDFNLNSATVGLSSTYSFVTQGVHSWGKALLSSTTGNLQVDNGDYFQQVLTGNITIDMNPGGAAALASGQRKVIVLKQPTTGGTYDYTVAWPVNATPTVTACTVVWQSNAAPVQPIGQGATAIYVLDTYDGATWYGRVYYQNNVWNYIGTAGQPAFGAGWSNVGGGNLGLAYRLTTDGDLQIRGYVNNSIAANAAAIFTLPAAYQPLNQQIFPMVENGTVYGNSLVVQTNGEVTPFAAAGAGDYSVMADASLFQ